MSSVVHFTALALYAKCFFYDFRYRFRFKNTEEQKIAQDAGKHLLQQIHITIKTPVFLSTRCYKYNILCNILVTGQSQSDIIMGSETTSCYTIWVTVHVCVCVCVFVYVCMIMCVRCTSSGW